MMYQKTDVNPLSSDMNDTTAPANDTHALERELAFVEIVALAHIVGDE